VKRKSYEAPHYAVFSSPLYFISINFVNSILGDDIVVMSGGFERTFQSWTILSYYFRICLVRINDQSVGRNSNLRGCFQTFPDWPPGARTANGTALCYWVQLYRYFVSQSSEFFRHNTLCCFSTSVYYCCWLFRYDSVRRRLDTLVFHDPLSTAAVI
jgi:hypothetical protein